ncbi:MAG: hypothetical protein J6A74_00325 [Oscillospiraceae bacterium]|nr:hypothetical protein [Oscillospiraceae bacterium]
MRLHKGKLSLAEIALFGVLGALTFGAKVAMSGLPNIEPVSLMVMLMAVVFGWKALYPVYLYVLMEVLLYGINLWNINYLYVWTLLAVAAILMRRLRNPLWWALLSGVFGMAFGLLCAPVYIAIGGVDYALRWWLSGIVFDIPHAIGNFVIALLLFAPLRTLLQRLYARMRK